jgi:hypothetical protein
MHTNIHAQYALPERQIDSSVIVLCVDASSPWTVATALNDWSKVLGDYIRTAAHANGAERLTTLRKHVEAWNRSYVDDEENVNGQKDGQIQGISAEDLPLKEGCLVTSSVLGELMPECEYALYVCVMCIFCSANGLVPEYQTDA